MPPPQGNGHERDFMGDKRVYIMDVYNRHIYPGDRFAKRECPPPQRALHPSVPPWTGLCLRGFSRVPGPADITSLLDPQRPREGEAVPTSQTRRLRLKGSLDPPKTM